MNRRLPALCLLVPFLMAADAKPDLREFTSRELGFSVLLPGQPEARIVEDFDRDRWFTAEEAREYGMVDVVLDHRSQLPSGRTGVKTGG